MMESERSLRATLDLIFYKIIIFKEICYKNLSLTLLDKANPIRLAQR